MDEDIPYLKVVLQEAETLVTEDTRADEVYQKLSDIYGIRAFLAVPLIIEGKPTGVLSLISTSRSASFTDAELDFAYKLGVAVCLTLNNIRLYEAEQQAHQRLQQQHSLLQQALIPANPPTVPGYNVASRFIAGSVGEQVGGDFFDLFKTKGGELAVLIGDVSGKGVEAASLAVATRSTIRAFAYDRIAPGQVLTHTNAVICSQGAKPESFVTVFLAIIDLENGKLRYSDGGHPPAMIWRVDGSVELVVMTQFPIGMVEDAQYQEGETWLGPGDKLLMYTDGISESHSGGIMYNTEGIEATLREQGGSTPEEILEALFSAATKAGGGCLSDDAAAIILERHAAEDM
jgi:serine phosphatase RsbU (regulator of sigma subunit)